MLIVDGHSSFYWTEITMDTSTTLASEKCKRNRMMLHYTTHAHATLIILKLKIC
jgi:hypothetical protein